MFPLRRSTLLIHGPSHILHPCRRLALHRRAESLSTTARTVTEWSYTSAKTWNDPFNDVTLDALITTPAGAELRVPAFWAGDNVWRVRFAADTPGRYRIRTESNDPTLHARASPLDAAPNSGANPLFRHGRLRIAADRHHFEHSDGQPFFWLGDTWWMGLCNRLHWPDEFRQLAADRLDKGFSVIQIIAGLYPDMPPFDPRGANESGCPWKPDYSTINPAYFDMADLRIQYLVDSGLTPCIVGCWGYFLPLMGIPKMKQHWRNLIARWGAYPVIWCLAGEGTMPYYLSKTPKQDSAAQKTGWTDVARFVRHTDPSATWSPSTPPPWPATPSTTNPCSISTCSRPATATAPHPQHRRPCDRVQPARPRCPSWSARSAMKASWPPAEKRCSASCSGLHPQRSRRPHLRRNGSGS